MEMGAELIAVRAEVGVKIECSQLEHVCMTGCLCSLNGIDWHEWNVLESRGSPAFTQYHIFYLLLLLLNWFG